MTQQDRDALDDWRWDRAIASTPSWFDDWYDVAAEYRRLVREDVRPEGASAGGEDVVIRIADIINEKVTSPNFREDAYKAAHRLDQIEAARAIVAALSTPSPAPACRSCEGEIEILENDCRNLGNEVDAAGREIGRLHDLLTRWCTWSCGQVGASPFQDTRAALEASHDD